MSVSLVLHELVVTRQLPEIGPRGARGEVGPAIPAGARRAVYSREAGQLWRSLGAKLYLSQKSRSSRRHGEIARTLPGQDAPPRPPRLVAAGRFGGDGARGGVSGVAKLAMKDYCC